MIQRAWWVLVCVLCAAFVLVILLIWQREIETVPARPGEVANQQALDSVLKDYLGRSRLSGRPVFVPTGVFIQSVQFESASDVNLTGFIWQKYANDIADDVSRGFLLPEQVSSTDTVIDEVFRRAGDGYEVIGWYFDVTVRQTFDYSKYPLDNHDVWLRLWHRDFDRKVILVPDFSAYDSVTEFGRFGIDRAIVSDGWKIMGTWFGYKPARYDTNFGIADYIGQRGFPELYFHVVMSRGFLNPFVASLLPLLVVAVLLFTLLISMTTDEEQSDRFGFDLLAIVGAATGLLFVVILAHIDLRADFPGNRISYLEYFYLIMYGFVLLIGFAGYLDTYSGAHRIPRVVNAMKKLAFWPLLLGSLALTTVLVL